MLALQRSPQRGIIAEVEPAGRIASEEVRIAENKQQPLNLNFLIIPFENANKKCDELLKRCKNRLMR